MTPLPVLGIAGGGAIDPGASRERALRLELFGVRMPAALTLPAHGEPASAILLIPGSLFLDVDGSYPSWGIRPHVYADLARQLAARGHAVLRYAKIGPGTGSEVIDERAMERHRHFLTRVETARAAVDLLLAESSAMLPVILAGHSEGAVVAYLAAARDKRVTAVVSLSGPSVGLLDVMREQLPVPPGSPPEAYAAFDRAVEAIRAGEALGSDLRNHPLVQGLSQLDDRSLGFLAEVDAVDPAAEIAKVPQPVLIIQGERDASVGAHHADRLRAARGELEGDAVVRFPELQHFYKRVEKGIDPMTSFRLETESDPAVAEAINEWVRHLAASEML